MRSPRPAARTLAAAVLLAAPVTAAASDPRVAEPGGSRPIFIGGGDSPAAAELAVEVRGLRSDKGEVRVGLFDTPKTFATDEGKIAEIVLVPEGGVARGAFADLAPGTYALAAYHDENVNRTFDRGLFGWPLEGYGFSNDAPVFLGAPPFAKAAFPVPAAGAGVVFRMVYW